jgi:hypothetical protein
MSRPSAGPRATRPLARLLAALCLSLPGATAWAASAEHLGAERCGTCHAAEYQDWKGSAHARALDRLTDAQRRDPTCRSCHTMVPGKDDPALAGVQCESCHGAGSLYAPSHVMRDEVLAELLGLTPVTVQVCAGCHAGVGSRVQKLDLEKALKDAGHRPRARAEREIPSSERQASRAQGGAGARGR